MGQCCSVRTEKSVNQEPPKVNAPTPKQAVASPSLKTAKDQLKSKTKKSVQSRGDGKVSLAINGSSGSGKTTNRPSQRKLEHGPPIKCVVDTQRILATIKEKATLRKDVANIGRGGMKHLSPSGKSITSAKSDSVKSSREKSPKSRSSKVASSSTTSSSSGKSQKTSSNINDKHSSSVAHSSSVQSQNSSSISQASKSNSKASMNKSSSDKDKDDGLELVQDEV